MTFPTETRSYEYHPLRYVKSDLVKLTGLELLQRMIAGELAPPPIMQTLDYTLVHVEHGRVVAEGTPKEWAYNPLGSVHGGYAATLLDSVVGCAVHSTLPAGTTYTTLELKLNFTRALLASTGPVRAEGKIVHAGSKVATAEGRLVGVNDQKLYAHATTTCLIMPLG
ncbi:MAG: PaaI family thioesterase [Myxococcales bacterium]